MQYLQTRGRWLILALRSLYLALGGFGASSLIAVTGPMLGTLGLQSALNASIVVGVIVGVASVVTLIVGCALMVRETRLAVHTTTEEIELLAFHRHKPH